jgi:deazaflavin-dependent oxidoreductase (nitroreductase family)
MQIPRVVAIFNKYINNRIQGLWAWLLPPWAVIGHTGRKSGKAYRTPVFGFVGGGSFAVPILYGERTDWVRNLLAANGGTLQRGGRRYELRDPRIVPAAEITLRGIAGRYARMAPSALIATIGPRVLRAQNVPG